jgi:PAS domain S-box-containing protein
MRLLLLQSGYHVLTANNGHQGFEAARQQHPDLVISDVSMPRMDGIEMCRRIRQHSDLRLTPVLLVSAIRRDNESASEGMRAGADDYLELPYDSIRLIAKVERLLERRRADKALKFQAHLLDTVEQAVIATDLDGKITYWNRFAERLYGWSSAEAVGRNISAVTAPQTTLEQASEIMANLQAGKSWSGEFLVQRKDGTTFPAMVSDSPIYDDQGRMVGIVGISYDFSERKQAEALLVYQANLLANVHDAILATDEQYRLTAWNRAAEELYGWKAEEVLGRQVREVIRIEFTDAQHAEAIKGFANTGHYQTEAVHHRRDGTPLYVQGYTIALHDESGRITGYVAANRDISKHKQVEEKLRQSEGQLAEAQRLAHIGSWNWDLQNNTLTWTEEHYRIFGLDPQEYTPTYETSLSEHIHPEDREVVRSAIENFLRTQEPFNLYFRIVRPDGEIRVIHSRGNMVSDEQGTPIRVFGTAQDVTERMLAEEQFKSSNDKLRALSARLQAVREEESLRIARAIHDEMGGALTGLKIDLSWLGKQLNKPGNEGLYQKLDSMAELIDETIQKVRNISTQLRPSVLDDLGLAAAIEWLAREFQRRSGVRCNITALAEEVTLSPEKATAVFRIFQEILTNVARHAGATLVEIDMAEHEGDLVLKVSDNGRGIKERESADSKSLGLLGMRERALVFGGRAEGQGTTVVVSIPRA